MLFVDHISSTKVQSIDKFKLWKDALEPNGLMNEDLIDLSVGKMCN